MALPEIILFDGGLQLLEVHDFKQQASDFRSAIEGVSEAVEGVRNAGGGVVPEPASLVEELLSLVGVDDVMVQLQVPEVEPTDTVQQNSAVSLLNPVTRRVQVFHQHFLCHDHILYFRS